MTHYFSSVTTLVILLVSSSAETNITENNSGSEEKKKNRYSNVKLEVKIHQRHFGEGFWFQRLVGVGG